MYEINMTQLQEELNKKSINRIFIAHFRFGQRKVIPR